MIANGLALLYSWTFHLFHTTPWLPCRVCRATARREQHAHERL